MGHLLSQGEIKELLPENEGGGLSGEVHLVRHNGQKYVLRKCDTYLRAARYETYAKKFAKYHFLPKFLGREGKNIFLEFIEGRDLTSNDSGRYLEQVGAIAAHINNSRSFGRMDFRFMKQVNELISGKYSYSGNVDVRRYRDDSKADKRRIKALFSTEEGKEIKNLYKTLKREAKPKIMLDTNDISPNNYRLRNGRVYLVDIEALKARIKGFGIAKCFTRWAITQKQQEAFRKGYDSVSSMDFYQGSYEGLCNLMFLVQTLNYKAQIGRDYRTDLKRLDDLLRQKI